MNGSLGGTLTVTNDVFIDSKPVFMHFTFRHTLVSLIVCISIVNSVLEIFSNEMNILLVAL